MYEFEFARVIRARGGSPYQPSTLLKMRVNRVWIEAVINIWMIIVDGYILTMKSIWCSDRVFVVIELNLLMTN